MRNACLLIIASMVIALATARPAPAVLQFYKVYEKEYLDSHTDKKYAEEVKKPSVKCLVCHQGKNRKNHNPFGKHLKGLLDRKKDTKDVEKISATLKKVLELHVDPKDEKSETYFDRIRASKWPGGELDDLKKDPPKEQEAN